MKHDDPLLTALGELPDAPISSELSARIRREAHRELRHLVELRQPSAQGAPRLHAPRPWRWLDALAAAIALGVAAAHTGWAIVFVSGLYQ